MHETALSQYLVCLYNKINKLYVMPYKKIINPEAKSVQTTPARYHKKCFVGIARRLRSVPLSRSRNQQ